MLESNCAVLYTWLFSVAFLPFCFEIYCFFASFFPSVSKYVCVFLHLNFLAENPSHETFIDPEPKALRLSKCPNSVLYCDHTEYYHLTLGAVTQVIDHVSYWSWYSYHIIIYEVKGQGEAVEGREVKKAGNQNLMLDIGTVLTALYTRGLHKPIVNSKLVAVVLLFFLPGLVSWEMDLANCSNQSKI